MLVAFSAQNVVLSKDYRLI